MATVLFAWELGSGIGHLAPHRELLGGLIQRGHAVHVVACDLAQPARAFNGLAIRYWQCPVSNQRPNKIYQPTLSMAHILHNVGFANSNDLLVRTSAWRNLLAAIQPQLVLTDYSPTTLVALRGSEVPKVVLGTGFCLPPNRAPLPVFATLKHLAFDAAQLSADEAAVVMVINSVLGSQRLPLIGCLADLFHQTDLQILTTIRELDHYPDRGRAQYWGLPPEQKGVRVDWPESDRRRIFAYLKPFDTIATVLEILNKLALPSMVACDGLSPELRQWHSSATMAFAPPNVDLIQMAQDCHFAITNANHTTTCRFLLAGKPVMMIPLHLEQELIADAVRRSGAGVIVYPKEPRDAFAQLVPLLNRSNHHEAAAELAGRYDMSDGDRLERMLESLEALISRSV